MPDAKPSAPLPLPDVDSLRDTILEQLDRYRIPILGGLALAVFGGIGLTAWTVVRRDRIHTLHAELHSITDGFDGQTLFKMVGGEFGIPNGEAARSQAERLLALRERARGTEVEPLALYLIGQRWQVAGEDAKALAVLDELQRDFPDAPVLRVPAFDSERTSLASAIAGISRRRAASESAHKYVPPVADPSTVALVEYTGGAGAGAFKIAFYPEHAPKHVEAFLSQAKSGGFNGTQMYLAQPGDLLAFGGGDRTRNDTPRDDSDDDPALSLPPEEKATFGIRHVRGTVTSVKLLSGDQGDRFAVVLAERKAEFDAGRTPFGEILDAAGLTACDRLAAVTTYSKDVMQQGRIEASSFPNTPSPTSRVVLRRVSIWKDGELDAGHTWDTSRVNTDQDEPTKGDDGE
jgi:cyclophilin family peptidyl-prolyl cis-trans isomerase